MDLTAIIIVAIVFGSVVAIVKTVFNHVGERHKLKHFDNGTASEIERLKERIATLEKIVTDENYQLKKEFENLK